MGGGKGLMVIMGFSGVKTKKVGCSHAYVRVFETFFFKKKSLVDSIVTLFNYWAKVSLLPLEKIDQLPIYIYIYMKNFP